jgi:hypothetical protein
MIDTGSVVAMELSKRDFERQRGNPAVPIRYLGVIRNTLRGSYRARGYKHDGAVIAGELLPSITIEASDPDDDSNSMGMNLLCRYNILLDFPQRSAILSPSRFFTGRDSSDRHGLYIEEINGRLRISGVLVGSRGEKAGFLPADEIMWTDDGVSRVSSMSMINSVLTRPRIETAIVRIRRGDRVLDLQIAP